MSGENLRKSAEVSKGIFGTLEVCGVCAPRATTGWNRATEIAAIAAMAAQAVPRNGRIEHLISCAVIPLTNARPDRRLHESTRMVVLLSLRREWVCEASH